MSFQINLKKYREKKGLSQGELAQLLGVGQSTVGMWENGKNKPRVKMLEKITEILDVTTNDLINVSNVEVFSYDTKEIHKVPVLGKIPAGIPIEAIEDILDYIDIPENMLRGGKSYFALKIKGDSMTPKYEDGDVVLFERTNTCDNGSDCAVMVNGDDATFKRVEVKENGIMLKPMNPNYETTFYTNEEIENKPVRIIGIARQVRRDV